MLGRGCPPPYVGGYDFGFSCDVVLAEDASQFVLMMEFGAANRVLQAQIRAGGCQHPQRGREKVNPNGVPKLRQYGAAKRARWIHAHAGDGRFKRDERRHARARKQTGEAGELLRIRGNEHDGHQDERDDDLPEKCRACSAR